MYTPYSFHPSFMVILELGNFLFFMLLILYFQLSMSNVVISANQSIVNSLQSRCSSRTHTKPRSILVYSSRIHTCHWLNAQGYWGSIWTPLYHSTSTSSMWQRVSGRNNILKALADTSWGQQKR